MTRWSVARLVGWSFKGLRMRSPCTNSINSEGNKSELLRLDVTHTHTHTHLKFMLESITITSQALIARESFMGT